MQGKDHLISDLVSVVRDFETKLSLFKIQFKIADLSQFPTCKILFPPDEVQDVCSQYVPDFTKLEEEFRKRFPHLRDDQPRFQLFTDPFAIAPDEVAPALQMELIELQCSDFQKKQHREKILLNFYADRDGAKFPNLKQHAIKISSLFGSTYVCEQTFSVMKLNKSKLRSNLTDEHLHDILRT